MSTSLVRKDLDPERVRQGATVRTIREMRGLRLGELASALRPPISYAYLSNIEAGRKPLTPRLAAQLADALGVRQIALVRPDAFAQDAA